MNFLNHKRRETIEVRCLKTSKMDSHSYEENKSFKCNDLVQSNFFSDVYVTAKFFSM